MAFGAFAQSFSRSINPLLDQIIEENKRKKRKKERSDTIRQGLQSIYEEADPSKIEAFTSLQAEGVNVSPSVLQEPEPPPDMTPIFEADPRDADLKGAYVQLQGLGLSGEEFVRQAQPLVTQQRNRIKNRFLADRNTAALKEIEPVLKRAGLTIEDMLAAQTMSKAGFGVDRINLLANAPGKDKKDKGLAIRDKILSENASGDDLDRHEREKLIRSGMTVSEIDLVYNLSEKGQAGAFSRNMEQMIELYAMQEVVAVMNNENLSQDEINREMQRIETVVRESKGGRPLPHQESALDRLTQLGGSVNEKIEVLESREFQQEFQLNPSDVIFLKGFLKKR